MMNLLPPEEKKELALRKSAKLTVVLGSVVIIALVSLILVLAALRFYILQDLSSYESTLNATAKNDQVPDGRSYYDIIKMHNAKLAGVNDFYKKESSLSNALEAVLSVPRPAGLYFTNIAAEAVGQGGKVKIIITGFSDTRDQVLAFKSNMESNTKILNAIFPPNTWVKPADIDFYVTLEVSPD